MVSEFSVIICAYTEERWHELLAAIESVQHQTLPPQEIIVVIDRNPHLLGRLREHVAGIIVLENNEAKGASGARNSGSAVAKGGLLAFLDDDAVAQPDWLEKLAACYTDSHVVGVGGKIEPRWGCQRPRWFPDEFNWVVGCSYRGLPEVITPVRNVIGANMSVRREMLRQVGGFRESFGNNKGVDGAPPRSKWLHHHAGDEETEFCMRVTQQLPQSQWLYTPSAVVRHYVPPQRTHWRFFLWRCYDEGLGKASLVKLHNTSTGLSSERAYTLKALPLGVGRGLADLSLRLDGGGLLRAGTILIGLASTMAGYMVGSIFSRITASTECAQKASFSHYGGPAKEPPVKIRP